VKLAGSKLTKKSITGKVDCSTFFPIMMLKKLFQTVPETFDLSIFVGIF
jgi:hypothetical protein